MKTFYIKTLGCKVNQYESDGIAASLEDKGMVRAQKAVSCDVCIINTCAVTARAGMQSRQAVRKLARDNPKANIIVTGCHAQTDPRGMQKIAHPLQVVCHQDKTRIADHLFAGPKTAPLAFKSVDHGPENRFRSFDRPVYGGMTRAYLKIQDGCSAFCTYCIVPYARGASVSMPEHMVLQHLEELGQKGFSEVILTGIHAGLYGRDLTPRSSLVRLVETIQKKKPVHRIRLSSIEPNEIDDRLLDLAAPGGILCDHFHVPLQSGDDTVLKKMKRPYTAGFFADTVARIREKCAFAGIGVDVMAGFPTETDQQFETTFNLIRQLPVSYLHVFPFSPRQGTPAFHFTPKVEDAVIKERCRRLRELGRQKQAAFITANLGRVLEGVVHHSQDPRTGRLTAVTTNYLNVFLKKNDSIKGKMVDLVCEQCDSNLHILGKLHAVLS